MRGPRAKDPRALKRGPSPAQRRPPTRVFRLWFALEGSEVKILRFRVLTMQAPPSEPIHSPKSNEGLTGAWIEVRDAAQRCLWRQTLYNPFGTRGEVRTDAGGFLNAAILPHGSLTVLVPELPEARHLAIFSSPLDPRRRFEPADQIAVIDFPPNR